MVPPAGRPGPCHEAALRCFNDWLNERGGAGFGEETQARRALLEAIETHGRSRFQVWHVNADRAVITNRMGFVRTHAEGDEVLDSYQYFVFPAALKEILKGLDVKAAVKSLLGNGIVAHAQGPQWAPNKVFHVPNGGGEHRLYQIDRETLAAGEGGN